MGQRLHHKPEMYQHFMRTILKAGDALFNTPDKQEGKEIGIFSKFPHRFIGRLDNPGVKPGLYFDRSQLILEDGQSKETVECHLSNEVAGERSLGLPDDWHFIDYNEDFIEDLPDTLFIEGDIVRLTDENHEHYSEDLGKNQFTVYRIDYTTAKAREDDDTIEVQYRLRAGPLLFYANENQIKAAAQGLSPIRIFESGQTVRFATLQSEAEFYLLIGCYKRGCNPIPNA